MVVRKSHFKSCFFFIPAISLSQCQQMEEPESRPNLLMSASSILTSMLCCFAPGSAVPALAWLSLGLAKTCSWDFRRGLFHSRQALQQLLSIISRSCLLTESLRPALYHSSVLITCPPLFLYCNTLCLLDNCFYSQSSVPFEVTSRLQAHSLRSFVRNFLTSLFPL